MSSIRELHNNAMRLAQLAMVARHEGDQKRAEALAREAYEYETRAVDLIPEDESSEPTRSILYLSAASLAYQCTEFHAAQRLIAKGLSGYPPKKTEQDLKDLYEQVKFEYYLQEHDVVLESEDLQLSMQGNAVGAGMILYDEFARRVDTFLQLVTRTVQRMMGREYQRSGRIAEMYKPFVPALAAMKAGSFIVTLKLGRSEGQQIFYNAAQVIDEIVTGVELINNSEEARLRERIQEEGYYQHFITSTRTIAPDGDRISLVGLTTTRGTVSLTRQRSDIASVLMLEEAEGDVERKVVTIEGELDYATKRRGNVVGLTTEEGEGHNLLVKEGMDDLVRSYYGQWVVVTGIDDGKQIHLTDIESGDG